MGNIDITTVYFIKTPNKNEIQLKFHITPSSNISNSVINQMFVPSFPYQDMQLSYSNATGDLECNITYNSSLNAYDNLQV